MAKKKQRKSKAVVIIALVLIVVVLAVAWGIGCQITGELNPANWGNRAEQPAPADNDHDHEEPETAVRLTAPRLAFKTTSATDGNEGIEFYALDSVPNTCISCGSIEIRFLDTTATCTSAGIANYTCDECLKLYQVNRPALGHNFRFTNQTTAPTCATEGSALYTCSRCKTTETRSVPATGVHNYSWVITTYPVGDGAGVESYKCATCSSVTQTRNFFALPADPVKEGYHFVGWYKDEALTIPYENDYIYEDTSLYAKFDINEYTVTFDSDGGSQIDSITADWNTSITPETPDKEGYNFLGWYMTDGTKYEGQAIKAEMTLRARWAIIMFTITFYVDGEIYTTKEVEYGSALVKVIDEANRLNLVVMSVCSDKGTYIEDCADIQITENYSIVVREMSGNEKVVNIIKNNLWYIIGGVVAFLAICCGIGFAVSRKKAKG